MQRFIEKQRRKIREEQEGGHPTIVDQSCVEHILFMGLRLPIKNKKCS